MVVKMVMVKMVMVKMVMVKMVIFIFGFGHLLTININLFILYSGGF